MPATAFDSPGVLELNMGGKLRSVEYNLTCPLFCS